MVNNVSYQNTRGLETQIKNSPQWVEYHEKRIVDFIRRNGGVEKSAVEEYTVEGKVER